jgi:hypothetical protein
MTSVLSVGSQLMCHAVGPGNTNGDEYSIEEEQGSKDSLRGITNEIQLEQFIQVVQTAQVIMHKQEEEKVNMRK